MRTTFLIPLLLLVGLASAAAPAADEASLGNGMIKFAPPPEPWKVTSIADHGTVAFYRIDEEATLMLAFVGNKAPKTEAVAQFTRNDVRDQLLMQFRQKKLELMVEPRFENDDRFFVVVYEQFRKDASVHNQWHIYKTHPPHLFVATLMVAGTDPDRLNELRKHAEDVLVSSALVPKGAKAPPPPVVSRPEAANAGVVEDAKKGVDDAVAKAVADLERKPAYQAALGKMQAAEKKLREARDKNDPDAVSAASVAWIESKGPVESMRKDAVDSDAGVREARRKLAEARKPR